MTALPLLFLSLLMVGCPANRSGGDDDDDVSQGGNHAWVRRATLTDDGGADTQHSLLVTSYPGACSELQRAREVTDELNGEHQRGLEDIEEEFGEPSSPGYQQAQCELLKEFFAGLHAADLPSFREGSVDTSMYLSGFEEDDAPAGDYTDSFEGLRFFGSRVQVDDASCIEEAADTDCSDLEAAAALQDCEADVTSWGITGGTLSLAAPSTDVRAATTEDMRLVRNEEDQGAFELDAEFPACDIDWTDP